MYREFYENCRLCPRYCGVNRVRDDGAAHSGFCGETDQLRVAYVGSHFGEEPPITGTNGSGTVFLRAALSDVLSARIIRFHTKAWA